MSLMTKNILFVFEGRNTEPAILENLRHFFITEKDNIIVEAIFDAEIFQFMKQIKEDPFLDLIVLLKKKVLIILYWINIKKVDLKKWNIEDWYECITENFIRCFILQHGSFENLEQLDANVIESYLKQNSILQSQLNFYLKKSGRIVIISVFALFILDYYGSSLYNKLNIHEPMNKSCSYNCLKSDF
jgi:hypothetical protein